jgi:hypothetical protein
MASQVAHANSHACRASTCNDYERCSDIERLFEKDIDGRDRKVSTDVTGTQEYDPNDRLALEDGECTKVRIVSKNQSVVGYSRMNQGDISCPSQAEFGDTNYVNLSPSSISDDIGVNVLVGKKREFCEPH